MECFVGDFNQVTFKIGLLALYVCLITSNSGEPMQSSFRLKLSNTRSYARTQFTARRILENAVNVFEVSHYSRPRYVRPRYDRPRYDRPSMAQLPGIANLKPFDK